MSGPAVFDATSDVQGLLAPLRLSVRGAGCDGRILSIRAEECFVGSGADCKLRLPQTAPEVACVLVRRPEGTFAKSRSSEVRLNGVAFYEEALRPGDRISVGDVEVAIEESLPSGAPSRKPAINLPAATLPRRARWDGALLVGEVRRLQQELREAAVDPEPSRANAEFEREKEALSALAETERAENERLRQELTAAQGELVALDARIAELDSALRDAEGRLADAQSDREEANALREQAESLRAMLADAEEKLEARERVYGARLQHAAELAEEERLAAVNRAIVETENRLREEQSRAEASNAERLAEARSRASAFERDLAERNDRVVALEREVAAHRPDSSIEVERTRFREEQATFASLQQRWDEERAEYERLAAEQTSLIAQKQRELQRAYDDLEASKPVAEAFVETDRLAWEEEKAAFEEVARSRMEELAEKTRLVEERLRIAAERQREAAERERLEIQQEREALAREHEALSHRLATTSPSPSYVPVEESTGFEPRFKVADESAAAPQGGFRFFGDLDEQAASTDREAAYAISELPGDAFDIAVDRDALDPEESERQRLRAESRLERFAHPERVEEANDRPERAESPESFVADRQVDPSAGVESGFLLRSFLNDDDHKATAEEASPAWKSAIPDDSNDESSESQPEASRSVADVLARLGHSLDALEDDANEGEPPSFAGSAAVDLVQAEPEPVRVAVAHEPEEAPRGDDDSIEDYMARLLRRVRGDAQVELTKPVEDVARTVVFQPATPIAVEPVQEETQQAPLTESEFIPRSEAPEQGDKLSAMRAIANETTRSAIFSSAVRRTYGKTATLAGLAGGAAVVGALVLWFGAEQGIIFVLAGLAIWGFAGWWGFRASKSLAELRRLSKPTRPASR